MSAFVVDPTHIDALLTAADMWRVDLPVSPPGEQIRDLSLDETGAMLLAVNTDAVCQRYEGRNGTDAPPEPYTFNRLGINIKAVVVLNAIACYRYQACEHRHWRADRDFRGISAEEQPWGAVRTVQEFLDDLERSAIRKLPGWDDAPWEIRDPEVFGPQVVRLF